MSTSVEMPISRQRSHRLHAPSRLSRVLNGVTAQQEEMCRQMLAGSQDDLSYLAGLLVTRRRVIISG